MKEEITLGQKTFENTTISGASRVTWDSKILKIPSMGDLLLGQIVSVSEKIATVLVSLIIRIIEDGNLEKIRLLKPPGPTHAYIFKGDVKFPCVNLSDILKLGDLVLGRVKVDWFKPVFLSLDTEDTGVVSGICSNCGAVLPTPRDLASNTLVCPRCKSIRKTKVSKLYEPIIWREIHLTNRIQTLPPA